METIDRFLAKVAWSDNRYDGTRCLVWTGAMSAGYGTLGIQGRSWRAHCWLYERWIGPVSEGLELDHLCRTTNCVNPIHLEPVTHQENMARGKQASQTHCIHGHEFTEKNTLIQVRSNGRTQRVCRTCRNRRKREFFARKRAH